MVWSGRPWPNEKKGGYIIPTDGHKSFYGKAKVIIEGKKAYLQSYNTIVMGKDLETGEMFRTWDGWTATTGRHIKSFAGINKEGFFSLPMEK